MMKKTFSKDEVETIVLQTILARPYKEINSYRIYPINNEAEERVIKGLSGSQEASDLLELESAINEPEVAQVYIPKFAAITSKGLKAVLKRTSLKKTIDCAFDVQE